VYNGRVSELAQAMLAGGACVLMGALPILIRDYFERRRRP
jgi:hypothetical protein